MSKLLVVEDDNKIARVLCDFLESENHEVTRENNGADGLKSVLSGEHDLVILDIMLPGKDGYEVCRELRAAGLETPVIMLTAKGQEIDKVLGLELGADDYVTKPFGLKELHARIRSLLRRSRTGPAAQDNLREYRLGDAVLDFVRHEIRRGKKTASLSSMEVKLLKYLVQRRGEVVERNDLLDSVWGYDSFPTTRTVDTHVWNLRKKLEKNPRKPQWLITVHGSGYRLNA